MLTTDIRKNIAAGYGDRKLAELYNVTRHAARKWLQEYEVEAAIDEHKLLTRWEQQSEFESEGMPPLQNSLDPAETFEEWGLRALAEIERLYEEHDPDCEKPAVRIGRGFCSSGKRGSRIGECWHAQSSDDDHYEIFISPVHATARGGESLYPEHPHMGGDMKVLDTVFHEYTHAYLWANGHEKHNHGPVFKAQISIYGGIVINRKGGTIIAEDNMDWAKGVLDRIGPCPVAQLKTQVDQTKTQTTRQVLLLSVEYEDYKIRMPRLPITNVGLPKDPAGNTMVIEPLSALKTEFIPDDLISMGYATKKGKGLEITEAGRDYAQDLIYRIIHGE